MAAESGFAPSADITGTRPMPHTISNAANRRTIACPDMFNPPILPKQFNDSTSSVRLIYLSPGLHIQLAVESNQILQKDVPVALPKDPEALLPSINIE
jgi:hypothetical protein